MLHFHGFVWNSGSLIIHNHNSKSMRLGNIFLVILELTWASESNLVDPNCPWVPLLLTCDSYSMTSIVTWFYDSRTGTKTHALRESLIKGKSPCQFYFANKIFSDYDLSLICSGKCDDQYLQCISNCSSDANCLMDCNRDSVDCSGCKWLFIENTW